MIKKIVDVGLEITGTKYDLLDYYHRARLWNTEYSIQTLWIDPTEISRLTGEYSYREYGHLDYHPHFMPTTSNWRTATPERVVEWGSDVAGDWDRSDSRFSDLIVFRSMLNRFENGYDWEDTEYYRRHLDRIQSGNKSYCSSKKALDSKVSNIDKLYNGINKFGYLDQRKLNGKPTHEVTITIGRDGEIIYNSEGRHRLSIAKIIGVDQIPAIVLAKHSEYNDEENKL